MGDYFRSVSGSKMQWINLDSISFVIVESGARDKAWVHFNHAGSKQSPAVMTVEGREQVATLIRKLDS